MMKQNLRFIIMTLLCAVWSMAWGQETTTIEANELDAIDGNFVLAQNTYTLTFSKNNGSTQPSYNSKSDDIRLYAKGSVTISTTGENMTCIVFNISAQGKKRLAPITASVGTIATQASGDETVTWTGNSNNVTFTVGDKADYGSDGDSKAGQLCFNSVVITAPSPITLVAPSFAPMPTEGAIFTSAQTITITNNASGSKVYYTLDGSTPTASSTEYTTSIKLRETTTLNAIAIKGNEKSSVTTATYTINIPDVATINDLSPTTVNVNTRGTFNLDVVYPSALTNDDYELSLTSSDDDLLVVGNDGNYIVGSGQGTVNVTVHIESIDEDLYKNVDRIFEITIIDPNANDGSIDKPFTVAEARAFIDNQGGSGNDDVYVKGIVSNVIEVNGYATYFISDDGTTTSPQLQVYQGYNIDGVGFDNVNDLQVADEVKVCGKLALFNSSIYQFNSGSQIVTLTRKEPIASDITITPLSVNVENTGTFTATITLGEGIGESDYFLSWTSSDENSLVVENNGSYVVGDEAGEVTITVTVNPSEEQSSQYRPFRKTFDITIIDPNRKGSSANPYTVAEVREMSSTTTLRDVWVKGYIVGDFKSAYNQNNFEISIFSTNTNLALASGSDETNYANTIPVELPSGDIRTKFGLSTNPGMKNVEVLLHGNIEKYFGVVGFKGTNNAHILTSISEVGYSTLYFGNTALVVPSGVEAYTCNVNQDKTITHTTTFTVGNVIPAGTAVLLHGAAGTYSFEVSDNANGVTVGANMLRGHDVATETSGPDANTQYKFFTLSLNAAGEASSVGFYYMNEGGAKFVSEAHKAYLAVPTSIAGASSYIFDENTGIKSMEAEKQSQEGVYTLSGVRMRSEQLPAGLYIVNGKKMIIK